MEYENAIVTAIAEYLEELGIGEWDADAAYPPTGGKPCIFVQVVPEFPRAIITLSPYRVAAAWPPNDGILGLQVRTRTPGSDPRPTNDLDSKIARALHGIRGTLVGGHRVTKVSLQSSASLGQDENERWGRSANYYITGPQHNQEDTWPPPSP